MYMHVFHFVRRLAASVAFGKCPATALNTASGFSLEYLWLVECFVACEIGKLF